MNAKIDLMWQYLNGDLTQAELNELSALIRNDREFRREAALLLYQEVQLGELAQEAKKKGIDWLAEPERTPSLLTSLQRSMSDYRLGWALTLGLACFILCFAVLRLFPYASNEPRLAAVRGGVHLVRAGQRSVAVEELRLQPGDRVVLDSESSATVRYPREGTWIRLYNLADAQLGTNLQAKVLGLEKGALSAVVAPQPAGRPLSILTPRAVASVLGTEFTLTADEAATRLEVWKGRVGISRRVDESALALTAGEYVLVQDDHPLQAASIQHGVWRQSWRQTDPGSGVDLATIVSRLGIPNEAALLEHFQAPANVGDGFVARLQAFLRPPQSGPYQFWVAGDDAAELWLSRDEEPNHKVKICATTEWTGPEQWDGQTSQRSASIFLEAGRSYYMEAVQQEKAGGDHLAVAWLIPGGARDLIRGQYLTPAPQPVPPPSAAAK